jgi:hypothetical protein
MKVFMYIILGYLLLWDYASVLLLKAPTNISEDHEHKISISQKGISEAREIFFQTSKAHPAQVKPECVAKKLCGYVRTLSH